MSVQSFAGFTYPRHVPMIRMDKPIGHRVSTAYYMRHPDQVGAVKSRDAGWSFYLASNFAPGLRWHWCDDVAADIRHPGWFTDDYGDGDKIRGVVFVLPHGRGYLAGWSMGESMSTSLDAHVWDDIGEAAHAADDSAERAAERQREYEAAETARLADEEREAAAAPVLRHVDTCLPCYLTDHFSRPGELLIGVAVTNATTYGDLITALEHEWQMAECDGVTSEQFGNAILDCFEHAKPSDVFDASLDGAPDDEADDCAEQCQAWFVLSYGDDREEV